MALKLDYIMIQKHWKIPFCGLLKGLKMQFDFSKNGPLLAKAKMLDFKKNYFW